MPTIKWNAVRNGVLGKTKKSTFLATCRPNATLPQMMNRLTLTRNSKVVYETDVLKLHRRSLFDPKPTEFQLEAEEAYAQHTLEQAKKFARDLLEKKVTSQFDPARYEDHPMRAALKASEKVLHDAEKAAKANLPVKVESKKTEEDDKPYTGPLPAARPHNGLKRLLVPTTADPVPVVLKDAKFSTLLQWGEAVRDHYAAQKKFPTANFLFYGALMAFPGNSDRCQKASKRIAELYKEEFLASRRQTAAMIAVASAPPAEKKEKIAEDKPKQKEKKDLTPDSWGYRKSSEAHAINKVFTKTPKTPEQIKKESAVERDVMSHVRSLIAKKLVKEVDGKFRLRKGVEAVS